MTNQTSLVVQEEVLINASPSRVWEVLTKPKYVAQWDNLPEGYPDEDFQIGSQVVWDLPVGGQSITTVINALENNELRIALSVTTWEEQPNDGDVVYVYQLEAQGESTLLHIAIGDFSLISDGEMYYEASVDFAADAKNKIKQLAEQE